MKFISRGLSIKDVRIVGGGRVGKGGGSAKNRQRWTESNTLNFKENVNMPFEDKENVNMPFEDTRLVADT